MYLITNPKIYEAKIDSSTIIVGSFNTPLSIIEQPDKR